MTSPHQVTASGAELDYMVAQAEGKFARIVRRGPRDICEACTPDVDDDTPPADYAMYYSPSTEWHRGGPIIERERIWLTHIKDGLWTADIAGVPGDPENIVEDGHFGSPGYVVGTAEGSTPLEAAMRCFVMAVNVRKSKVPA